ncbi:MAG TPA: S8 family serine peptidase [Ornithinimicrobium sp.]|uniref:S8 family serine peptidase n=1 Tax=Ornithinimicrobium sp. TaxID=1977084 RepID=UPI002B498E47|nr:S8 family serine peptidase [Ornithinimicrobium sp.]HKJ12195.1 S8 family serine peptidase [Ornithinimicrobium sp.]
MIENAHGGSQVASPHRSAEVTGRYVVVMPDGADPAPVLTQVAGMRTVASSRDFGAQAVDMDSAGGSEGMVFAELGIAVVEADPDQVGALQAAVGDPTAAVQTVVPELIYHILPAPGFLEGYRAGVEDLSRRLGEDPGERPGPVFEDGEDATWGLHAIGWAPDSPAGAGIRVAVLDTGMDLEHPDFAGRAVTAKSFVEGEGPQDGHGHGTHCIGSACGGVSDQGRRYGVASEAEIYAGKVLGDSGSGSDAGILAGINWAVANECAVISMSLGADVPEQHPPYVVAGRRALERGSLIIAAAGNNADRPGDPGFVGTPANSPAVMAVGAVDSALAVARFSARSLPGSGGQVDLAGPGVEVFSSWPMPERYHSISGTSMATPHAAGVAAVWAAVTGRRGLELWATLDKQSRRLELPSVDVGAGLVQVGSEL